MLIKEKKPPKQTKTSGGLIGNRWNHNRNEGQRQGANTQYDTRKNKQTCQNKSLTQPYK